MAGPTLGGLFGGLAQGAEAGMRLNQYQQGLDLQQENQQRLMGLASAQENRMKIMQDRQALVDQLTSLKAAGDMPPGPMKDSYLSAMLGPQGLGFSEDMTKTIRKQSEEEAGLYDSMMATFLQRYPQMGLQGAKALFSRMGPKELGQMMIGELRRQRFENMTQEAGAVSTGLQPQAPGLPQGTTFSPAIQLPPEAAIQNLRMSRDKLAQILGQTADAGEREQVTQLIKGIDERMTALQQGPGGPQRPSTLQFTDMIARAQKGDPQALAWLNYYKQYQVPAGGAMVGAGTAGALAPGPQGTQAQPGSPFGVSRPVQPSEAAIDKVSALQSFVDQATALADLVEKRLPDDKTRADYALRVMGQRIPLVGTQQKLALSKEQQEVESAAGALRLLFERSMGGTRLAASPQMYNRITSITSNPSGAQAPTAIRAIAKQAKGELDELLRTQQQAGQKPLGTSSGKGMPDPLGLFK